LGARQILLLMRDVCGAVQHAHQRGVIHRDLKPSNILITTDGAPHVVDFGLARAIGDEPGGVTLTHEGQWAGTPAFMAPEQAAGDIDAIDTRTDVYGLGATLYLLLTGRPPHDMKGPRHEVLRHITASDVRLPREITPRLDGELSCV